MSTYTYPAHRTNHWVGNAPTDCDYCKAETDQRLAAIEANEAARRDHRDDGNPFAGLLFALLATAWVIAMWVTVAGVLNGAALNGGTFWLTGITFALAYITRKA